MILLCIGIVFLNQKLVPIMLGGKKNYMNWGIGEQTNVSGKKMKIEICFYVDVGPDHFVVKIYMNHWS